jgi:hypothetical protein
MTTFTVDPATLEALSTKLSSIHNAMDGMSSLVSIPQGLLGGSDIEGTLGDACNHWHYGTKKLADHMKGVVQRLDAAAQTYSKSEDAVQAACGKSK